MTNPYQSPAATNSFQTPTAGPRNQWSPEELARLVPLPGMILVLRIIVIALALGVVAFGIYTLAHNAGRPQTFGGKLDTINLAMLGFGFVVGVQGIVLPGLLFRFVKLNPATLNQFAQYGPEVARVLTIQGRIQTSTIVGCALFEGGAFANLFWYMTSGELLHLAMAGLLLLGILARFPLVGTCERRIADELRRQDEEASIRGT